MHTPAPHVRVAMLLFEHTDPHPPQLSGLVAVLISQPSTRLLPLQSAAGAAQVPLQFPPPQVRVAIPVLEQAIPQPPQLSGFVAISISQPSACLFPLQSAFPAAHVPLHTPATHVRVCMPAFEQTIPHPPQLLGSVFVSISHPSVFLFALQSALPAAHVPLQTLAAQVRVCIPAFEQAIPHPPQLSALEVVSSSHPFVRLLLSQSPAPVAHVPLHWLFAQVRVCMPPAEQAIPHPPQLSAFVVVSISHPSVNLSLLQSAVPELQAPVQAPPAQAGAEMLLLEQAAPQRPQFAVSVWRLTSQPFVRLSLSQSPKPESHAPTHCPPSQMGVAMFIFEQTRPQPPQLFGSVSKFTQAAEQHVPVPQLMPHCPQCAESELLSTHTSPQQMEFGPFAAEQSPSFLHPSAQANESFTATHFLPCGQLSLVGTQGAHSLLAVSQRGLFGSMQSASEPQSVQAPKSTLQLPVLHCSLAMHSTQKPLATLQYGAASEHAALVAHGISEIPVGIPAMPPLPDVPALLTPPEPDAPNTVPPVPGAPPEFPNAPPVVPSEPPSPVPPPTLADSPNCLDSAVHPGIGVAASSPRERTTPIRTERKVRLFMKQLSYETSASSVKGFPLGDSCRGEPRHRFQRQRLIGRGEPRLPVRPSKQPLSSPQWMHEHPATFREACTPNGQAGAEKGSIFPYDNTMLA